MIVTDIIDLSKSRSKIYVDGEFAFVLYKGELRLYHVALGEEITTKDFEQIVQVVLPKRAKLRAMNLLQKRAYTEKQLVDKLKEGYYSPQIVEEAIRYVKSFGYVNDYQYAMDYLNCYAERKALNQIKMNLLNKGISKEQLQEAMIKWEESGNVQDEYSMIKQILEKKGYDSECDAKEKRRIYAFLLRRGYSAECIQEAMRM